MEDALARLRDAVEAEFRAHDNRLVGKLLRETRGVLPALERARLVNAIFDGWRMSAQTVHQRDYHARKKEDEG